MDDELLGLCVARLNGEYRCVLRPNGSRLWLKWSKPDGLGGMPVDGRQVLQALRGLADPEDLRRAFIALQRDVRAAVEPECAIAEYSEAKDGSSHNV
jgi:hypothetical protein